MAEEPSQKTSELSAMREVFSKEILRCYMTGRNLYEWRTRDWIRTKIREVEETEYVDVCPKYQVEETDGIKALKIVKDVRGENLQIVPMEDYFDIIYAAHFFTAHGPYDEINNYLKYKNLYVPRKAILLFIKNCEVCVTTEFQSRLKFGAYHAFLELIELSDSPELDKKFVMHYKVLKLRHAFLRLLSSNDVAEVVEQLLGLFNQVGPPRMLHTRSRSFTEAIILRLAKLYPKSKIIYGKEMKFEKATTDIKDNLSKWMSRNKSGEYSKGMYYYTSLKCPFRLLDPDESEDNMLDPNQPGPSSVNQNKTTNKQVYKTNYHENISPDEVLQLLKKDKNTPKTQLIHSQILQANDKPKKVYKTYTKKKTDTPQMKPLNTSKDEPPSKKALCVNPNIKEIAWKPSEAKKKRHAIWNSALDLPDQKTPNVKNVIGIDLINTNFGTIPKEPVGILDELNVTDEIRHLEDPDHNPNDPLEIYYVKKEAALYSELVTDVSTTAEEMEENKDAPITIDFHEEKPGTENVLQINNLNNIDIKEESSETSTLFNDLNNDNIQDEKSFGSFGVIVKVESMTDSK